MVNDEVVVVEEEGAADEDVLKVEDPGACPAFSTRWNCTKTAAAASSMRTSNAI